MHDDLDISTPLTDEKIWTRKLPRRRVLGGMLIGTAGLAMPGVLASRARGASGSTRRLGMVADQTGKHAALAAAGFTGMTSDQAKATTPDGFLPDSIAGVFASSAPGSMILIAGPDQKAVTVALHPDAVIWAGPVGARGDVSACNPGDLVFAATTFSPVGGRIASFVEVNAGAYWGMVTAVSGTTVSCTTLATKTRAASDIEIEITPATETENGIPLVGDGVYCVATRSTPANPGRIWARFIETFDSPTWG